MEAGREVSDPVKLIAPLFLDPQPSGSEVSRIFDAVSNLRADLEKNRHRIKDYVLNVLVLRLIVDCANVEHALCAHEQSMEIADAAKTLRSLGLEGDGFVHHDDIRSLAHLVCSHVVKKKATIEAQRAQLDAIEDRLKRNARPRRRTSKKK